MESAHFQSYCWIWQTTSFLCFSYYCLKTDTSELSLLPSPTLQELNHPPGGGNFGIWREGALDPPPQPLLQGSNAVQWQNFSSTFSESLFFLVQRAGWAVKWGVFTRLGQGASLWCFTDRLEVSQLCPMPAGHWPALNWKPSNNTIRACTVLEMRMLISASHFSVIQQWSSFFLFYLFSFFSSFSFPFYPLFLPTFKVF